ncbi:MAG: hypothetical protein JRC90_11175 [Deltaproteobacteria bacterium]|nr:hypothetical protein [Deltaproteobacteria bacterium]
MKTDNNQTVQVTYEEIVDKLARFIGQLFIDNMVLQIQREKLSKSIAQNKQTKKED